MTSKEQPLSTQSWTNSKILSSDLVNIMPSSSSEKIRGWRRMTRAAKSKVQAHVKSTPRRSSSAIQNHKPIRRCKKTIKARISSQRRSSVVDFSKLMTWRWIRWKWSCTMGSACSSQHLMIARSRYFLCRPSQEGPYISRSMDRLTCTTQRKLAFHGRFHSITMRWFRNRRFSSKRLWIRSSKMIWNIKTEEIKQIIFKLQS